MDIRSGVKGIYNGLIKGLDSSSEKLAEYRLKHWDRQFFTNKFLLPSDSLDPRFERASIQYWKQYTSDFTPLFHKLYSSRNGICDVRYIPDDLYDTKIGPFFNNRHYSEGVADKNYCSLLYPEVRHPITIVHKINGFFSNADYDLITFDEAFSMCSRQDRLIIKPTIGTGGSAGISFWNKEDTLEILKKLLVGEGSHGNLIVQEVVRQHEQLSRIHPSSINTVRTISLLFKDKVHILSSILRMGVDGSRVDNCSAGGWLCGIQENGQLKEAGYTSTFVRHLRHPQGFLFSEGVVPSYDKILTLIRKLQGKMAHFRLISWDFAVGEDGEPIFIEANLFDGAIDLHQICNGPVFGDLTEEVLDQVFKKR